jgi:hypothetical protein
VDDDNCMVTNVHWFYVAQSWQRNGHSPLCAQPIHAEWFFLCPLLSFLMTINNILFHFRVLSLDTTHAYVFPVSYIAK